jgi:nitrite reductase (NADH) large subunit
MADEQGLTARTANQRGNGAAGLSTWRLFCVRVCEGRHEVNAPASFKQPGVLPEKLVVIGNGMAGCRAVEELLARDPARYSITILGAEPRVNYNRIMLSPVLAGEKSFD